MATGTNDTISSHMNETTQPQHSRAPLPPELPSRLPEQHGKVPAQHSTHTGAYPVPRQLQLGTRCARHECHSTRLRSSVSNCAHAQPLSRRRYTARAAGVVSRLFNRAHA